MIDQYNSLSENSSNKEIEDPPFSECGTQCFSQDNFA